MRQLIVVAVLASLGVARADEAPNVQTSVTPRERITFGFRVGGYGFREPGEGTTAWEACRMNGFGLYAQRGVLGPMFVEAGADLYFAAGTQSEEYTAVDRVSGLLTVAAGVRTRPTARVIGYAQVGAGLELTRVSIEGVNERELALPEAFFGIGVAVRATDRLQLGANFRVHAMGYFEGDALMEPVPEAAAQGQFFVGYEL